MSLSLGKLPIQILRDHILPFTGVESKDVVVLPSLGLDFAVIRLPQCYLITSSDPITGVKNQIGWYAVNVSANDVATSGAKPRFIQSVILLPPNANVDDLKEIISQIHKAAKVLQITVTGGHTELTPGLDRPIVITTCFGLTNRFVTSADAEEGDIILMTKTAAIEGTSILAERLRARLRGLGKDLLTKASMFQEKISIVKEAGVAFNTGLVHAMHDPTEGGLVGGVYEMAIASNLGFEINEEDIPVADETREICTKLKVDPLRLISSGVLLIAAAPKSVDEISDALTSIGVEVHMIGSFIKTERYVRRSDGKKYTVMSDVMDELWRLQSSST